MRYFLTGAQGTGKTTIMNALPVSFNKIQGITRQVIQSNNLLINEESNEITQRCIFDAYIRKFTDTDEFISERSLIDVVAYTTYLYRHKRISKKFLRTQERLLKNFIERFPECIYFYLPITFDIQDDGVRSTNKEFQQEIDEIILSLLNTYKCSYFKLYNNSTERAEFINFYIQK